MNINDKLDFLQIQEVTTKRQKANGTREFKLPVNDPYGDAIHVASFATGYVRRTKVRSCWQLNKTKKQKRYVEMTDYDTMKMMNEASPIKPVIKTFYDTVRILIPNEQDRLEYLISYCLKNYYIGQANMLSNGNYIPKWKYNDLADAARIDYEQQDPEIKVIVNGHRYNLS